VTCVLGLTYPEYLPSGKKSNSCLNQHFGCAKKKARQTPGSQTINK
jgi:hypothetical protein